MKNGRYLLGGLLCLLLFCCVEEELYTDKRQNFSNELISGKNKELTISAAANWYVNHEKPVTRMGVTQDNLLGVMVAPSWNHAKEWKKGKYEVVEASLRSNTNVVFYDRETYAQKDLLNKKDQRRIMNVGRTIILKNLETGEIISFNMVIIGSQDYLLQQDGLSNNNYLHREAQFDGMILYFNLDGNFVNGWKYEKGKITKSISPALRDDMASADSFSSVTTRSGNNCYETTYPYSYLHCPAATRSSNDGFGPDQGSDWGPVWGDKEFGLNLGKDGNADAGSLDDVNIIAPSCYWITIDVPITVCNGDGGASGGGYQGGGDIPTPPSTPKYPKILSIIKDTTKLSAKQLDKLENAIREMESKLCYAKQILNRLSDKGFLFNSVSIDPRLEAIGANGANSIKGENINLLFASEENITYGTFAHELTHLLQENLGKNPDIEKGMMEYERTLIDDIMYYAQHRANDPLGGDKWIEKGMRSSFVYGDGPSREDKEKYEKWQIQRGEYSIWLEEITKNGVPASISTDDFQKWIWLFSEHSRPYSPNKGYNYDSNYTPTPLMEILNLTTTCY